MVCISLSENSIYEQAVKKVLEEGPLSRAILVKLISPKIMSQKKLQNVLNEMEDEKKLICIPRRDGESKKWSSWYALAKHKHLLDVESGTTTEAIKKLKLELLRVPTVEEIARELCIVPEEAVKLAYRYGRDLGWHPPSEEEIQEAEEKRGRIITLASLMKEKPDSPIVKDATPEDVESAKYLLKNHPELIQGTKELFKKYTKQK